MDSVSMFKQRNKVDQRIEKREKVANPQSQPDVFR